LTPHIEIWRVLEKYYKLGKLKSIGISNFNKEQIQDLYDKAEVKPQNLQACFFYTNKKKIRFLGRMPYLSSTK
jgi:diketogulonate reductase-like aldo/keto reductase